MVKRFENCKAIRRIAAAARSIEYPRGLKVICSRYTTVAIGCKFSTSIRGRKDASAESLTHESKTRCCKQTCCEQQCSASAQSTSSYLSAADRCVHLDGNIDTGSSFERRERCWTTRCRAQRGSEPFERNGHESTISRYVNWASKNAFRSEVGLLLFEGSWVTTWTTSAAFHTKTRAAPLRGEPSGSPTGDPCISRSRFIPFSLFPRFSGLLNECVATDPED